MIKKIILLILLLTALATIAIFSFVYRGIYSPKDTQGESVVFTVKRGDGLSVVASNLEQEELISRGYFFIIYGQLTEQGGLLKPGSYNLSSQMSVVDIMETIVKGDSDRVTIVEGWNIREISNFLEERGFFNKEDFFAVVGAPPVYHDGKITLQKAGDENLRTKFSFLQGLPENVPYEGYLFPDTYHIVPGTTAEEVVEMMLRNFERRVYNELIEDIEASTMSLQEIVVKASLLEKEVRSYEDKQIVAGIINNRLQKGMRLQLDATVTYLTGRRSVQVPLTETRIQSPYNTYTVHGLPLAPITNPGIESIKATLNPTKTSYYYYLSKPSGETVFSRTHDEHVRAKNLYLR